MNDLLNERSTPTALFSAIPSARGLWSLQRGEVR